MAEDKTSIAINMNINKVPGTTFQQNLSDQRHVVLNLDAVVINPKKKSKVDSYEKFDTLETENLKVLAKCHRLFVTKCGEPWLQTYGVRTPANQRLLTGKSDEVYCYVRQRAAKRVYFLNCKDKETMRIEFEPIDYKPGTHERSFNIKIPGHNYADPERKLGTVKLQDINNSYFLHGISNSADNSQFTSRSKRDTITILLEGQPVAIIDLQRTKILCWIESYMITFTKEISYNSKALVLSAVVSYDIAFCRRSDSIKTIIVYLIFLFILFSGAALLFIFLIS